MIVRDFNKLKDTDRSVSDAQWIPVRMLLADDGMGFRSTSPRCRPVGAPVPQSTIFESVFCMQGKGSITDLGTGETHEITPGVMYALNLHDKHILRAEETLVMACCFNPPVTGTEVHQEDGSYAPAETA